MEKQIEEMINIMCHGCARKCDDTSGCIVEDYAEAIYNAGYRKQNEGEWIEKNGLYVCSECDKTCPYDAQADDISYWECKFCPNCGAKMKG